MTRLGPTLVAVGLALLAAAIGEGHGVVGTFAALALVAGALLLRARRRSAADQPWATSPSGGAAPRRRPPPDGSRRVAVTLGRFEARELVVSPWFAVGLGFCAFMAVDFAYLSPDRLAWDEVFVSLPFLAHPLVGMAVLASHRSAGRAERDGVGELFDALPTPPADRRAGVLLAAVVPVLALAAFFAFYLLGAAQSAQGAEGPVGPAVPILLSGLLLGAGGAALGVVLARAWVQPVAPVLALVAIGLMSPRLAQTVDGAYEPRMLLSTFPPVGEVTATLTSTQEWLHAAWLLFLTIAMFMLALVGQNAVRAGSPRLRHERTAQVVGAGR